MAESHGRQAAVSSPPGCGAEHHRSQAHAEGGGNDGADVGKDDLEDGPHGLVLDLLPLGYDGGDGEEQENLELTAQFVHELVVGVFPASTTLVHE